jgi:hypothetical protein
LPPTFQESNESSREERNVDKYIFEVFKRVTTMGEGLEETLQGLKQHFLPHTPTIIVISDYEEEEHVEKRVIDQLVEVEQPKEFLLELV